MKEQFLNIFNASTPAQKLKFNRRVSVIIVCFFIAAVFWLLIALSKEYSALIRFPVDFKNIPGQKVVVNDLPGSITMNVKTSGFKILSFRFKKEKIPVEIDVASKLAGSMDPSADVLVIPSKTFSEDFNNQLGGDITIVNFLPDSVVFNFSNKITKRVPVKLDMTIGFEKQFDSIGMLTTHPDSVDVSGPGSVVNKTDFISTEHINLVKIKDPVSKKIKLLSDKLLLLSDTLVKVTIPVEKFTEESMEVPVKAIDIPKGYVLKTFPDKITVRYQVSLSRYNSVTSASFNAMVDGAKAGDMKGNKMNVKLVSAPSFIKSVTIEPERVDYILRKQ